jgi:hypothetical protein
MGLEYWWSYYRKMTASSIARVMENVIYVMYNDFAKSFGLTTSYYSKLFCIGRSVHNSLYRALERICIIYIGCLVMCVMA